MNCFLINCYFCKQLRVRRKRLAIGTGEDWTCDNHPHRVTHEVNYTYHKKGDCEGPNCCPKKNFEVVSIRWSNNESFYDAEWNLRDKQFKLFKLNHGAILTLADYPSNVTPENVEDKMAMYITFS